ncbi:hypothetical protein [Sphingomonas sp. SUN039]|uniref:hypothetical protein n=1 Tax=Sphingomonas sp. SUN039 TaxID=2937787 RepID=UPI002164EF92|nr:hypothetical protein [Sphingomonas sp. SUN039]UVO52703.1 hypothetical protein M0209_00645 [Sphingomonas sp. SUN039]
MAQFSTARRDCAAHMLDQRIPSRRAIVKFLSRLHLTRAREEALIAAAPDREVLRDHIFPQVAAAGGRILLAGVRGYTADYPARVTTHGAECWTIDYDPAAAPHGVPGRHVTGDIGALPELLPDVRFDAIFLTGLFGFGVYGYAAQTRVVDACTTSLNGGGLLVIGWNDRRGHPGVIEELAMRGLAYAPLGDLPPRIWIDDSDYNFAFLRRTAH